MTLLALWLLWPVISVSMMTEYPGFKWECTAGSVDCPGCSLPICLAQSFPLFVD